jgi:hypothetical protein
MIWRDRKPEKPELLNPRDCPRLPALEVQEFESPAKSIVKTSGETKSPWARLMRAFSSMFAMRPRLAIIKILDLVDRDVILLVQDVSAWKSWNKEFLSFR